jgi:hypothetical protein
MNKTKIILFIISLKLFIGHILYSQNYISGQIFDSKTKEILIGAYLIDGNSKNISITNENGEFKLNVFSFPAKIYISFIGYEKKEEVIIDSDSKSIFLNPIVYQLDEVTVSSNLGAEIVNRAVKKALSDSSTISYHKAYYQKTSSFNGKYNKLYELFLNVSWGQFGVKEWQPTNARYAYLDSIGHTTSNFISLCFINSGTLHHLPIFPLNPKDIQEKYVYKLLNYQNKDTENEIATIECKPKSPYEDVSFEGKIYINTTSNNILQIRGNYTYPIQKSGIKKAQFIDINFKELEKGFSVLNHLYIVDKSTRKREKNIEKAWLYFYDEISAFNKTDKKYPSFVMNEKKIFENSNYNKSEWDRNIPIKYTDGEQEAIKFLGKNKKYIGNFKK